MNCSSVTSRRRIGLFAALMACVLVTASCGTRWDKEQRTSVLSRYKGERSLTTGGSGQLTVGADETTDVSTPGSATGSVEPGATEVGTGVAASGKRPCSAPSSAPGVTDKKITIGNISSLSGPVPGLGASSTAAVRSYVAYINANGGVCGRQVVVKEADDGTDSGRYRSQLTQLAPEVFAIVGGLAQGDIGGADIAKQTKIPIINSPTAADAMTVLPNVFDINPPFENLNAVIGKYKFLYDQGVRKASVVYLAVDQSRAEARVQQSLMRAAGIQIVQVQELPVSTLSYDSAARSVANSGADYVWFLAEASGNANFTRSMKETGYKLKFLDLFVYGYGSNYIDLAGDASEGATAWIRSLPVEDGAKNAELAKYIEWMDQVAPNDRKDLFAADGWASSKAFFDAMQALPGPITREALITQLAGVQTFDAAGFFGSIKLGQEKTNGCMVGMQVRSGKWVRLAPASGFLC